MSISSAVVSFISFFQNLSVNISLPHISFPSWFISFLNGIKNFIGKIQSFISSIPPFDMRTQLVFMSVFIPLVLDILFVWFVQPFLTTFFNVFDIAVTVILFTFCAVGFIDHWSTMSIVLAVILGIILIIRLIYQVSKKNSQDFQMIKLARRICNHFLYGIIPNLRNDYSINQLNNAILKFSSVVEIKPSPPNIYITINFLIVSILLFLLSLFFFDCYPFLKSGLADQFNTGLGAVSIVFSVIFLIVFVLRLFKLGRKFILLFKQFCRRWGIRLLMLFFDMLYIPIVSLLISHINVRKYVACPVGEYLYQIPDKYHNTISLLVMHNVTCVPCNISYDIEWPVDCYTQCNGEARWRSVEDPSLEFVNDIVQYSCGFLLYCVCFVMIGIPCLWYFVIKRNRNFALVVNVYGKSPQEKWLKLVNRMKTTGIFLFWNYRYNISIWAVLYLLVKFFVMLFSVIASRFVKYLNIMMPIVYLSVFIMILIFRPYLYFLNNLLDLILYFTQFLFSLNSILAVFNAQIPDAICTIFSVIVVIVPVVSIIFLVFFRKRHADFENDPTYPQKLEPEEEEELEQKRRKAKRKLDKELRKQKFDSKINEDYKSENSSTEYSKNENSNRNDDILARLNSGIFVEPNDDILIEQNNDVLIEQNNDALIEQNNDALIEQNNNALIEQNNNALVEQNNDALVEQNNDALAEQNNDHLIEQNNNALAEQNNDHLIEQNNDVSVEQNNSVLIAQNDENINTNIQNINEFNSSIGSNDINQPLLERNNEENPQSYREDYSDSTIEEFDVDEFIELEEFDENENICYIPEDEYEVQPGDLDCVKKAIKKLSKMSQKVTPEEGVKSYIVNKRVLANRMSQMYKMLDIVVDGSTIDLLTSVLNLAIIMGTGAVGWFIGTIIANDGFSRKPVCHFL